MITPPSPMQHIACRIAVTYCRLSPWRRGKVRLARGLCRWFDPPSLPVGGPLGTEMLVDWRRDSCWEGMWTDGSFEPATTQALAAIVTPDDVVFDVGANIGWYAVLFGKLVNPGRCHAFEPVPDTAAWLQENLRRNALEGAVAVNQVAVGDRDATSAIYTFADQPRGHASPSAQGSLAAQAVEVPMIRLDAYAARNGLQTVDVIKVDVEGGEMAVLVGAEGLLNQERPPVWILEINAGTAAHLGYRPSDLLERLQQHGAYAFYRLPSRDDRVMRIDSAAELVDGDNVLCVPAARMECLPAEWVMPPR